MGRGTKGGINNGLGFSGYTPTPCVCNQQAFVSVTTCFVAVWIILMLSLTFYTAPNALSRTTLYLEVEETRSFALPNSNLFASSKSLIHDVRNAMETFQFVTLPPLTGPIIHHTPIIPIQLVAPLWSGLSNNWLEEDYNFNAGSTATYQLSCVGAPVDFAVIETDGNYNTVDSALYNNQPWTTYALYVQSSVMQLNYSYTGQTDVNQEVYFLLVGSSSLAVNSVASCKVTLDISQTTYDLSDTEPLCSNQTDCTVDINNGAFIVLKAPAYSNPLNAYNGPNEFTVQADQYTIAFNQILRPAATIGAMMSIFSAGLVGLLVMCRLLYCYEMRATTVVNVAQIRKTIELTVVPPAPVGAVVVAVKT